MKKVHMSVDSRYLSQLVLKTHLTAVSAAVQSIEAAAAVRAWGIYSYIFPKDRVSDSIHCTWALNGSEDTERYK